MTAEVKELRDVLVALGLEQEVAVATLERLLPENVVYMVGNTSTRNE